MNSREFGDEEPYLAQKLEDLLSELREAEEKVGDSIAQGNYRGAAEAAQDAKKAAVGALEAVLDVVKRRPARPLKNLSDELLGEIAQAEARLGITPGTFTQFFDVNSGMSPQRIYRLTDVLQQVLNKIREQEIAGEIHEVPKWLPKLVTVVGVVTIGALVAAPLAALAVKESVVKELVKASIILSIAAVAEWFLGPAVDSMFENRAPSAPSTPSPSRPDPPSPEPSPPSAKSPERDPDPPDLSDLFETDGTLSSDLLGFVGEDPPPDPFKKRPNDPDGPKLGGPGSNF